MTDMLIRDVPDDVIAALDVHAGRLGLSRSEYVRRRLAQDAAALAGSPRTSIRWANSGRHSGAKRRIWPQFREAVSPARLGAVAQSSALYRSLSHYGVT